MNKQTQKLTIIVLLLLPTLSLFSGCNKVVFNKTLPNKESVNISDLEKKYVAEKAKNLTFSMYLSLNNYVKNESDTSIHRALEEQIKNIESLKIESLKISAVEIESNDQITVIIEVNDLPFTTVKFYEMEFKRSKDDWILSNIGFDA